MQQRRTGWMYHVPPVRGPRPVHYHGHHHHSDIAEAVRVFLWVVAALLWFYETAFWVAVWFYYGLFLAVRAGVRVGVAVRNERRRRPVPLPMGQPDVAPPQPQDPPPSQW